MRQPAAPRRAKRRARRERGVRCYSRRGARDHETLETSSAHLASVSPSSCSAANSQRYSPVMRQFLAARRAACWLCITVCLARASFAQTWNDPRSRSLVERASARRAQQLADTGLSDYQANAHGYVTFLAQLGEGFLTRPKIIKADELELEVYWRAPDLSKQRI